MPSKTTRTSFLPTLALALALVVLLAPAALARKSTVHFFVLPAAVSAQDIPAFNNFLVQTAGGFTASPSHGRGPGSKGKKIKLDNWSYTVAADKDLSGEIMDYLKTKCGLASVFMLVFEADRPGR
ncbi:MAG: hypothetical protein A2051_12995 [Desulfovibrionales bacterium GWA2_65_9]|nr:MAG: hypothetical protein A2051_12995 [Desulfovibrionales bacterium GWA2_65_9]